MADGYRWPIRMALLLALLLTAPFTAEGQAPDGASRAEAPPAVEGADEARRAAVLAVLERREVRDAARAAGLDLTGVASNVYRLRGEPLARAARQAEALDRRLAIDGTISSTTLVILLVITVLLIVILQD